MGINFCPGLVSVAGEKLVHVHVHRFVRLARYGRLQTDAHRQALTPRAVSVRLIQTLFGCFKQFNSG